MVSSTHAACGAVSAAVSANHLIHLHDLPPSMWKSFSWVYLLLPFLVHTFCSCYTYSFLRTCLDICVFFGKCISMFCENKNKWMSSYFYFQQCNILLTICTYSAKYQGKEENSDVPCRKRKVLHLVSQWIALYKDWLHEDEHSKMFLKVM